jgi:hypothetical protein
VVDEDCQVKWILLLSRSRYCYQCTQTGHKADACPNRSAKKNDSTKASTGRGGRGGRGNGRERTRFQGTCWNCGKQGHKESNCWQKEENAGLRPSGYRVPTESDNSAVDRKSTGNKIEYLLCALTFPIKDSKLLLDPNIWIADTAASVHMTAHQQGLMNIRTATNDETIMMGNGNSELATVIGTLPGTVCDQYGNELNKVAIENVSYLPNGTFNLFSLTQMFLKGWVMGNNKISIWIEKGRNKVTFDLMIPTPKGMMFAMYFACETEIAGATIDNDPTMTIEQAHVRLGHSSEGATRKTAKALNWTLTKATLKPCDACAAAKAKQKNLPKASSMAPSNTKKNESRIYLDIATINRPDKKQV